jgi:hypothetical protein
LLLFGGISIVGVVFTCQVLYGRGGALCGLGVMSFILHLIPMLSILVLYLLMNV